MPQSLYYHQEACPGNYSNLAKCNLVNSIVIPVAIIGWRNVQEKVQAQHQCSFSDIQNCQSIKILFAWYINTNIIIPMAFNEGFLVIKLVFLHGCCDFPRIFCWTVKLSKTSIPIQAMWYNSLVVELPKCTNHVNRYWFCTGFIEKMLMSAFGWLAQKKWHG